MGSDPERTGSETGATSWSAAILAAAAMIVLSFLIFVLIPNSLLGYLTTRMTPTGRDLVVAGWWVASFVIGCVVFMRLQRREDA